MIGLTLGISRLQPGVKIFLIQNPRNKNIKDNSEKIKAVRNFDISV
jgi:hypothetical protein